MNYLLVTIIIALMILCIVLYNTNLGTKFLLNRTLEINDRMISISEKLTQFNDINTLYKQLLQDTINLIEGAECGTILIYNNEMDYMEYKASVGFDDNALASVHLKKKELFLYQSTRLKSPDIIVNPLAFDKDNMNRNNFNNLLNSKSLEIKATLSAPLYINGEFYGMINVDNKNDFDAFDKRDLRLINYISKQLEIAIKNVLLMNELVEALRTDKLTTICNRRHFEEIMENNVINEGPMGKKFTLVMIDMDNFKMINDNYGHKMGDDVLRYFSAMLKDNTRPGDMVVRYAGDEFILVLYNADERAAKRVVDRIRKSLNEKSFENIRIQFSAGICEYGEGMSLDKVITYADRNMYVDKRKRKGNPDKSCLIS